MYIPTITTPRPIAVSTNEVEPPGKVEHPSPGLLRESKERVHEVAEVPAIHRLEHRAHDRAQHPQEAGPEPGEESRRCECPFLGRHDDPPLLLRVSSLLMSLNTKSGMPTETTSKRSSLKAASCHGTTPGSCDPFS